MGTPSRFEYFFTVRKRDRPHEGTRFLYMYVYIYKHIQGYAEHYAEKYGILQIVLYIYIYAIAMFFFYIYVCIHTYIRFEVTTQT